MKWPESLILMRHDVSAYNVLKSQKVENENYQRFLDEFKNDPFSEITQAFAKIIQATFSLGVSDANTALIDNTATKARQVGEALAVAQECPDIIFVSPYLRTRKTLEGLIQGWPELEDTKIIVEPRIREREHGIALLYNDWKVFHALNPNQRKLYEQEGKYWYRFPQGESIPDVQARLHSWMGTLIREFANKRVLAVTHHLTILSLMANLERWDPEHFFDMDEKSKPINCGITIYKGHPKEGDDGKFKRAEYNSKYYK